MAPLAARRLAEMVELGARVVSVELLLAAQACDLRGARLGAGTARAHVPGADVRAVPRRGRRSSRISSRSSTLIRAGRLGRLTMPTYRHPPAPLAAVVRRRSRRAVAAPVPPGASSTDATGSSRSTSRCTTPSLGWRRSTALASTLPCSRCSRRSARGARRRRSATSSTLPGSTGSPELVTAPEVGSRPGRWAGGDGFVGTRRRLGRARRPRAPGAGARRSSTQARASCSCTRRAGRSPPRQPDWWQRPPSTRRRCSRRTSRGWRPGGSLARHPHRLRDPRRRRAVPARAARVSRCPRALVPAPNVSSTRLVRTPRDRAVHRDVRRRAPRLRQRRPCLDPAPTLRAIRGFGVSVEKLILSDNPSRLLS